MTDLTPGPGLDRHFATLVEGYAWDEARCRVCGWPLGEWLLGVCTPESCSMRPAPPNRADSVAPVSTDDAVALAALERFAKKRKVWWTITRFAGRYYATLHGDMMPIYAQTAPTLAHAIVLALLAAVEIEEKVNAHS